MPSPVAVAGVAVDLADAACCEHHRVRGQRLDPAADDVECVDAVTARPLAAPQVARGDQVDRHRLLPKVDVRVRGDTREQGVVNRPAGGIGSVGDAPHAMAALAGQVQTLRAVGMVGERHTLAHQPVDRLGADGRDEPRGPFVDQPGTRGLRVFDVRIDAVVGTEHADDAALRPGGCAFLRIALGKHDHAVPVSEVQGRGQAGEPGADDDDRQCWFKHVSGNRCVDGLLTSLTAEKTAR